MKIVVAPDSFKECLDAAAVAAILSDEISRIRPDAEVISCPLSDGGEGFCEIVTAALGGEILHHMVTGPLGVPVKSIFGRVGDTAIIDAASACGLQMVPIFERNPLVTTSRGLGELLLAAYGCGCTRVLVGVGGTATCDGGAGMMSVPGVKELRGKVAVEILADVDTPFIGPRGAVAIFAPQKGATPGMMDALEERMQRCSQKILKETGKDISTYPGAGAGGGISGALMAYLDGSLRSGADALLEMVKFEDIVDGADFIITGEGKSDCQTLSGKVPKKVLEHSGGVPVMLLSGKIEEREALLEAGFHKLVQVTPEGLPMDAALKADVADLNLRKAVRTVLESI